MGNQPVAGDAQDIVRQFLFALQEGDIDRSVSLLAEDAQWINVSLPTVRGRRQIERILRLSDSTPASFRIHFHSIAGNRNVVVTERSDAITFGRFEHRFWVRKSPNTATAATTTPPASTRWTQATTQPTE